MRRYSPIWNITVIIGVFLLAALLFGVQILGQALAIFDLGASEHHPIIIQHGLHAALSAPWFIAEALWYTALGTAIHALLIGVPLIMLRDISRQRGWSGRRMLSWTIVAVPLFFLMLALWNKALFPFSDVIPHFDLDSIWPLTLLSAGFIGLAVAWLCHTPSRAALTTGGFIGLLLFVPAFIPSTPSAAPQPGQPNIVLIGVDSLRPDHLKRGREHGEPLMPHLESWLSHAVVFDNAVTPMARTFPALTSLLTAKYPRHNGARINLTPAKRIDIRWTLGKQLQKQGYTTTFATDDARFANFTKVYGFDHVSTPPQGLRDFIFGSLIDSIGTNLLELVPAGRWLNPVEYANRAAAASYRPAQFDRRLSRLVEKLPSTSSFLMVHFCLPHLPYVKKSIFSKPLHADLNFLSYDRYERGLATADKQFATLLDALRNRHMLDNAIVAVYSDHGEELHINKDQQFRRDHHLPFNRLGHGSSIFSPSQNHILLALQRFKNGKQQLAPGVNEKPALLTDVATTILPLLSKTSHLPSDLDGLDLLGRVPRDRVRYMESSVLMPVVVGGHVDRAQILKRFGDDFYITKNLRLRVKPKLADGRYKQRGAIIGNHVIGIMAESPGSHSAAQPHRWTTVAWPWLADNTDGAQRMTIQKHDVLNFFDKKSVDKISREVDPTTYPITISSVTKPISLTGDSAAHGY